MFGKQWFPMVSYSDKVVDSNQNLSTLYDLMDEQLKH